MSHIMDTGSEMQRPLLVDTLKANVQQQSSIYYLFPCENVEVCHIDSFFYFFFTYFIMSKIFLISSFKKNLIYRKAVNIFQL